MNISELTDMLVTSSQQYNQAKFNPWWEGDHKEAIYRYSIFSEKDLEGARDCVAGCGKEEIFSPVGEVGLTLFHLLVWHNFQDVVKDLLDSGKAGRDEGTFEEAWDFRRDRSVHDACFCKPSCDSGYKTEHLWDY